MIIPFLFTAQIKFTECDGNLQRQRSNQRSPMMIPAHGSFRTRRLWWNLTNTEKSLMLPALFCTYSLVYLNSSLNQRRVYLLFRKSVRGLVVNKCIQQFTQSPKVPARVRQGTKLVDILCQMSPVHIPTRISSTYERSQSRCERHAKLDILVSVRIQERDHPPSEFL